MPAGSFAAADSALRTSTDTVCPALTACRVTDLSVDPRSAYEECFCGVTPNHGDRSAELVTLPELFWTFRKHCSCWELYNTYLSLEICIHKKAHSASSTPNAQFRDNSRRWHKHETGHRGLPRR